MGPSRSYSVHLQNSSSPQQVREGDSDQDNDVDWSRGLEE